MGTYFLLYGKRATFELFDYHGYLLQFLFRYLVDQDSGSGQLTAASEGGFVVRYSVQFFNCGSLNVLLLYLVC